MTGTILVTGANGEAPPPPKERPLIAASAGSVQMVDFAFNPTQTTVTAGGSVAFVNNGVASHTATARDGSFDSGIVPAGGSYRATFRTPGTFLFYCTIHPQMTGTVRVVGADGAAPPPAAAPANESPPLTADVQIFSASLSPINVRIGQGGSVNWTAMTLSPHIIKADDQSFEGVVTGSKTFRVTFDTPGTYAYRDVLTKEIQGSVTVVADVVSVTTGAASDGSKASIRIIDFGFDPAEVTVAQHATVTWTNAGQAPHTVTSRDGTFTSDLLQQRDQYLHVFDTVGRFEYFCTLHPKMVGTIIVTDASGAAPPEVPSRAAAASAAVAQLAGKGPSNGIGLRPFVVILLTLLLLGFGASILRGASAQITGDVASRR
jgi:plastocyanin